jgi:hypothetical protein
MSLYIVRVTEGYNGYTMTCDSVVFASSETDAIKRVSDVTHARDVTVQGVEILSVVQLNYGVIEIGKLESAIHDYQWTKQMKG